jgi:type II secretory pathway pseudopilin PulG
MEILIVVAIIVILAGLGGYYLLPQLNKSKEGAAKAKAMTLDTAVQTYMTNHNGQAPASVAVLTQPDPENNNKPYVSDDAILDPWNQQYQLDPGGSRNKGAKPDVYTTSPEGKIIGNFR